MRMIDPLLMEFDREAATTRKVLGRCPDARLSWQPHPKSMPLGKLADHLVSLPLIVSTCILTEGVDLATAPRRPISASTAEIVGAFDAACAAVKGAMAQLDDAKAAGMFTISLGGKVLMTAPRVAFLRSILLNHSVHHRGQLTVYLRLLDVPVPSVYGPSADENPFG